MFDSVYVKCPKCGVEHEFQTKSGACDLSVYSLEKAPDKPSNRVMDDVNRHGPAKCNCGTAFYVGEKRKVIDLTAVIGDLVVGSKEITPDDVIEVLPAGFGEEQPFSHGRLDETMQWMVEKQRLVKLRLGVFRPLQRSHVHHVQDE
jgi:hypothetical protein